MKLQLRGSRTQREVGSLSGAVGPSGPGRAGEDISAVALEGDGAMRVSGFLWVLGAGQR